MDNNVLVLDINASTFTQLKDDFNDVLKEVLDNLVGRYLTEADITVSVHLRFEHDSKGALVAPVIQHVVSLERFCAPSATFDASRTDEIFPPDVAALDHTPARRSQGGVDQFGSGLGFAHGWRRA